MGSSYVNETTLSFYGFLEPNYIKENEFLIPWLEVFNYCHLLEEEVLLRSKKTTPHQNELTWPNVTSLGFFLVKDTRRKTLLLFLLSSCLTVDSFVPTSSLRLKPKVASN